jgi:hypothetical protein
MKVIFIDVDGPLAWDTIHRGKVSLNFGGSLFKIPYPWVEEDCAALAKVVSETGAVMVLSSDWRKHYSFFQMRRVFDYYGIPGESLVDFTTTLDLWRKMSRPSIEWYRAAEVAKWASDNKVDKWVAIDDLNLAGQFPHLDPAVDGWRHLKVDGHLGEGYRLRDLVGACVDRLS